MRSGDFSLIVCNPLKTFAHPAPPPLGGFFVIAVALDVLGQPLLFTHLLEALYHLSDRFITLRLDFDHIGFTFGPF